MQIKKAIAITILMGTTAVGFSQAIPGSSKPFINKFNIMLFSADSLLRTMDGYTTVNNLNDPCHCIHETNPLAPHNGSIGKQIAFQASALAITTGTVWTFNHYHHPKIARAIMMIDIANETRSVVGNYGVNHATNVTGTKLSNNVK